MLYRESVLILNYYTILFEENEDHLGKARQPDGLLNDLGGLMLYSVTMKHLMHCPRLLVVRAEVSSTLR